MLSIQAMKRLEAPELEARLWQKRRDRIRDAYEILSDPVKMLLYDTGGMDLVKKYEKGEPLKPKKRKKGLGEALKILGMAGWWLC